MVDFWYFDVIMWVQLRSTDMSRDTGDFQPVRLEVRQNGDRFVGDLVFNDGVTWPAWQVFKRLYKLKANARAAGFNGPIVRI